MTFCRTRIVTVVLGTSLPSLWPLAAAADVHHTVARGHTVEAIAARYRVPARSIIEANHLANAKQLRVGQVLTIPTSAGTATNQASPRAGAASPTRGESLGRSTIDTAADNAFNAHGRTSSVTVSNKIGSISLHRIATSESQHVRIADARGRISTSGRRTFEHLLRSPSGASHAIDPRLIAMVGLVSHHFANRTIEVISGYRPFTPTQHNPHSNHMYGRAIDFRVVGIPNESVHSFCRTLKNVGCGYYPNSVFVHMDVRDSNATWTDFSKPGEPPRYETPSTDADEGATDVHADSSEATSSPQATAGAAEPQGDSVSPSTSTLESPNSVEPGKAPRESAPPSAASEGSL